MEKKSTAVVSIDWGLRHVSIIFDRLADRPGPAAVVMVLLLAA